MDLKLDIIFSIILQIRENKFFQLFKVKATALTSNAIKISTREAFLGYLIHLIATANMKKENKGSLLALISVFLKSLTLTSNGGNMYKNVFQKI